MENISDVRVAEEELDGEDGSGDSFGALSVNSGC